MSHGNQSVQGLMLALEHFTALFATLCSNIIAHVFYLNVLYLLLTGSQGY